MDDEQRGALTDGRTDVYSDNCRTSFSFLLHGILNENKKRKSRAILTTYHNPSSRPRRTLSYTDWAARLFVATKLGASNPGLN